MCTKMIVVFYNCFNLRLFKEFQKDYQMNQTKFILFVTNLYTFLLAAPVDTCTYISICKSLTVRNFRIFEISILDLQDSRLVSILMTLQGCSAQRFYFKNRAYANFAINLQTRRATKCFLIWFLHIEFDIWIMNFHGHRPIAQ